jgi:hypothetical protein
MNIYKAYSLCIHSELQLPELIETEGEADVVVRSEKLNPVTVGHDGGDRCRAKVAGVGEFVVLAGREIIVDPVANVEPALLRTILLGPVLSVLLRQRGLLVLHASGVAIDNWAIAFLGGSGWGKSTLAAAFQEKGYRVLTDDVMAIDLATGCAIVYPSYPQGKLFPEAAASLGHDVQEMLPVSQNSLKLSCSFTNRFQPAPLPLQRIYVLAKGTAHQITALQPQESFVELVRHTRSIQFMTHADVMKSHLYLCTRLMQTVSFRRFARRPELADLPRLVKLIEDDLALVHNNVTPIDRPVSVS